MFYNIVRFLVSIYLKIFYKIEISGKENIPSEGSLILTSNHIHWADPILIACEVTNRKISFLGKHELFKNPILRWLLNNLTVIPIRRGEADVTAIKSALRVLKSGKILGIFPEGTRVKTGEEKKPESGTALLAIKSKSKIVPIGIEGSYKLGSKLKLIIGTPIELNEYYGKKPDKENLEKASSEIMKKIKELLSKG
ncbi:lysophospholipid acyltransferase family protein [Alkalibacter mobilis]|uniref:lysophospholipid acyltransferase family protein n=1 Tax=Alkalibacter mobilis TaxID=2787712 RepID=UPI00189D53AB|nr:lysophospholipid acyltransferase family protein [Alkalibacter mobilis]MBF7097627.1 1-acyl-sn-glycerol-3-phosphate acyltransferase [Alkalibacter mobilis]